MYSSQKHTEQKKPMTKDFWLLFFKFKNRRNQWVVMEIRKVTCGGWEIAGGKYEETFWDGLNILYLVRCWLYGYMHYQILIKDAFKISVLYILYMNFILKFILYINCTSIKVKMNPKNKYILYLFKIEPVWTIA